MRAFDYAASPVPVREEFTAVHERAWERLRAPGNWWTGPERVQIAAEVRNALRCELCRERESAVSPLAVEGVHLHTASLLSEVAIDAVHRIVTDATRLTGSWVEKNAANGLSDGHYVELLGITVAVFSIDELHRGLGLPVASLPDPLAGKPTHERPEGLQSGVAWVPMLPASAARKGPYADLYAPLPTAPNVIAAMSLVPEAVRQLKELSAVYYLPQQEVADPRAGGRALSRQQIEFVAARVSAANECFY